MEVPDDALFAAVAADWAFVAAVWALVAADWTAFWMEVSDDVTLDSVEVTESSFELRLVIELWSPLIEPTEV